MSQTFPEEPSNFKMSTKIEADLTHRYLMERLSHLIDLGRFEEAESLKEEFEEYETTK